MPDAVVGAADPRVETIWSMAQSQLGAQLAAVDELRGRVGTLLSAASIATGFLAGQALNTSHGVPAGAWLGMSAALALVAACAWILRPRTWAGQVVDAETMLEDADALPDETMDEFRRSMAGFAWTHFRANGPRLTGLYRVFSVALLLLCVDFAGWIWVLASE